MKRTPLKRSGKTMARTKIKTKRSKPRPGRLKGDKLTKLRDDCYERDGGRCVVCGILVDKNAPPIADDSYHMAHIKAKRIGGDSLDNVRCLCGRCHRNEHNPKACPPKERNA